MYWIETDTSTDGDRWSLENDLGIKVLLSVFEDRYVARILDTKWTIDSQCSLWEAKQQVKGYLQVRLAEMLEKLNSL